MAEDGALVGKDFSPRQLKAIELFATGEYNCTQVAELVKVSNVTISKWRRNTQFMDAIYTAAKLALRNIVPQIYKAAITEALSGKFQHIKILLDHLDNLDKESNKNVNGITISWNNED